jgi:hypothetical protein
MSVLTDALTCTLLSSMCPPNSVAYNTEPSAYSTQEESPAIPPLHPLLHEISGGAIVVHRYGY